MNRRLQYAQLATNRVEAYVLFHEIRRAADDSVYPLIVAGTGIALGVFLSLTGAAMASSKPATTECVVSAPAVIASPVPLELTATIKVGDLRIRC